MKYVGFYDGEQIEDADGVVFVDAQSVDEAREKFYQDGMDANLLDVFESLKAIDVPNVQDDTTV